MTFFDYNYQNASLSESFTFVFVFLLTRGKEPTPEKVKGLRETKWTLVFVTVSNNVVRGHFAGSWLNFVAFPLLSVHVLGRTSRVVQWWKIHWPPRRCVHFLINYDATWPRPSPNYAGVILKTAFSLWRHVKCFHPHYSGEIWKSNNHRSFWIFVWGKLRQGNHVIIVTSSFSKSFDPFSWRIGVEGIYI